MRTGRASRAPATGLRRAEAPGSRRRAQAPPRPARQSLRRAPRPRASARHRCGRGRAVLRHRGRGGRRAAAVRRAPRGRREAGEP